MVSLILAWLILREVANLHDLTFNIIAFVGVTLSSLSILLQASSQGEADSLQYNGGIFEIIACLFTVLAFASVNILSRMLKGIHFSVLGSA